MDPITAAAAGAALNIVGGIFKGKAQDKANQANRQHEINMFNMANAYNTPLKQRERLVEAGLNPALMYGGGSVSNTASPPKSGENEPVNYAQGVDSEIITGFMNYALMDKQRDLIDANIAQKNQAIVTSQADVRLKEFQLNEAFPTQMKDIISRINNRDWQTEKSKGLYPTSLQMAEKGVEKIDSDIDLNRVRREGIILDNINKRLENEYADSKYKAELMLITEKVVSEMLSQDLTVKKVSSEHVKKLIDKEVLKTRRAFGSPNATITTAPLNIIRKLAEDIKDEFNK